MRWKIHTQFETAITQIWLQARTVKGFNSLSTGEADEVTKWISFFRVSRNRQVIWSPCGQHGLKEHSDTKGTDTTVTFTNFLKGTLSKTCLKKKKREKEFSGLTIWWETDQQKLLKKFSTEGRWRQNLKVKKIHEKKGKVIQSRTCGGFIWSRSNLGFSLIRLQVTWGLKRDTQEPGKLSTQPVPGPLKHFP